MRSSAIAFCLVAVAASLAGMGSAAAQPPAAHPAASSNAAWLPGEAPVLVDINHASRETLKTLPGIGDAEADRIIAARPYKTKAELVTRKVLPEGVFVTLKGQVTVQLKPTRPTKAHKPKP